MESRGLCQSMALPVGVLVLEGLSLNCSILLILRFRSSIPHEGSDRFQAHSKSRTGQQVQIKEKMRNMKIEVKVLRGL